MTDINKNKLNTSSFEFYLILKKKYRNLKIAYNYNTIRIYISDENADKTKTLYYILNESGNIIKTLKKPMILGNIYDKNLETDKF